MAVVMQRSVKDLTREYRRIRDRKVQEVVRLMENALEIGVAVHIICKNGTEKERARRKFGDKPNLIIEAPSSRTPNGHLRIMLADMVYTDPE